MEGGAYLTTGDYAELLLMHLRGGMCGDEQVLSQDALDRMHADRIGPQYGGTTRWAAATAWAGGSIARPDGSATRARTAASRGSISPTATARTS